MEVCWERITAPLNRFADIGAAREAIERTRLHLAGHSPHPPDVETIRRLESQRYSWTSAEAMASDLARRAAYENRLGELTVYSDAYGVHLLRILQRRNLTETTQGEYSLDRARSVDAPLQSAPPRRFVPR